MLLFFLVLIQNPSLWFPRSFVYNSEFFLRKKVLLDIAVAQYNNTMYIQLQKCSLPQMKGCQAFCQTHDPIRFEVLGISSFRGIFTRSVLRVAELFSQDINWILTTLRSDYKIPVKSWEKIIWFYCPDLETIVSWRVGIKYSLDLVARYLDEKTNEDKDIDLVL